MDDIEETAPPRLTDDGAQLLADVLSKRANDRHNTLTERRHARRREADALRQQPTDPSRANPDGDFAIVLADDHQGNSAHNSGSRAKPWMRWLFLVSLGVAVGLAISFLPSLGSDPVAGGNVASSEATNTTEASNTSEAEELIAEDVQVDIDGDDVEVEVAGRQLTPAPDLVPAMAAGDIEVSVYDASPSNGEVYSFALRLKSTGTDEELSTEDFTVRVEDEFGIPATTFSRFIHETLPADSSALATVRAEEVGPGQQFVVVWYGDLLIDRILIENEQ